MIKMSRLIKQVLFDKSQLMFLKFQRRNVLQSDSASSSPCSDSNMDALFGAESAADETKLSKSDLNAKRVHVKNQVKERLEKFVGVTEDLCMKDWRILQGVLSKNFKTLE